MRPWGGAVLIGIRYELVCRLLVQLPAGLCWLPCRALLASSRAQVRTKMEGAGNPKFLSTPRGFFFKAKVSDGKEPDNDDDVKKEAKKDEGGPSDAPLQQV